ncbi:MAG TPA: DUF2975 domain-containing protein [Rhizomicrobium sp.]|nr:DUF2975 domain-containing protein [Rhizomicrobium sp.]
MKVSQRLVTASRIMGWLSVAGAVLGPVIVTLCFLFPHSTRVLDIHFNHLGADLIEAVPIEFRVPALLCALLPTGIASFALVALARLFRCYASGEVFSGRALAALSQVTSALFWYVLAGFVMQAPISLLLTYYRGHGHRAISLGFGSDDVEVLFIAGVTFVIARVMAEARRIADENEGFV